MDDPLIFGIGVATSLAAAALGIVQYFTRRASRNVEPTNTLLPPETPAVNPEIENSESAQTSDTDSMKPFVVHKRPKAYRVVKKAIIEQNKARLLAQDTKSKKTHDKSPIVHECADPHDESAESTEVLYQARDMAAFNMHTRNMRQSRGKVEAWLNNLSNKVAVEVSNMDASNVALNSSLGQQRGAPNRSRAVGTYQRVGNSLVGGRIPWGIDVNTDASLSSSTASSKTTPSVSVTPASHSSSGASKKMTPSVPVSPASHSSSGASKKMTPSVPVSPASHSSSGASKKMTPSVPVTPTSHSSSTSSRKTAAPSVPVGPASSHPSSAATRKATPSVSVASASVAKPPRTKVPTKADRLECEQRRRSSLDVINTRAAPLRELLTKKEDRSAANLQREQRRRSSLDFINTRAAPLRELSLNNAERSAAYLEREERRRSSLDVINTRAAPLPSDKAQQKVTIARKKSLARPSSRSTSAAASWKSITDKPPACGPTNNKSTTRQDTPNFRSLVRKPNIGKMIEKKEKVSMTPALARLMAKNYRLRKTRSSEAQDRQMDGNSSSDVISTTDKRYVRPISAREKGRVEDERVEVKPNLRAFPRRRILKTERQSRQDTAQLTSNVSRSSVKAEDSSLNGIDVNNIQFEREYLEPECDRVEVIPTPRETPSERVLNVELLSGRDTAELRSRVATSSLDVSYSAQDEVDNESIFSELESLLSEYERVEVMPPLGATPSENVLKTKWRNPRDTVEQTLNVSKCSLNVSYSAHDALDANSKLPDIEYLGAEYDRVEVIPTPRATTSKNVLKTERRSCRYTAELSLNVSVSSLKISYSAQDGLDGKNILSEIEYLRPEHQNETEENSVGDNNLPTAVSSQSNSQDTSDLVQSNDVVDVQDLDCQHVLEPASTYHSSASLLDDESARQLVEGYGSVPCEKHHPTAGISQSYGYVTRRLPRPEAWPKSQAEIPVTKRGDTSKSSGRDSPPDSVYDFLCTPISKHAFPPNKSYYPPSMYPLPIDSNESLFGADDENAQDDAAYFYAKLFGVYIDSGETPEFVRRRARRGTAETRSEEIGSSPPRTDESDVRLGHNKDVRLLEDDGKRYATSAVSVASSGKTVKVVTDGFIKLEMAYEAEENP